MRIVQLIAVAIASSIATVAHAQPIIVADSGDNGWMLAASLLVVVGALPGLALFYGRSRDGQTGLALFASAAIVTLLFTIIGYTLAFSDGTGLLGGIGNMMLAGLADVQPDMTIAGAIYALFELGVALFAVGILVGSVAERTRVDWLLVFAALWMMIVYVPVAHWAWGGGWLAALGALDYAGGLVVQVTTGVSALVVALLLGRDQGTDLIDDRRMALGGAALLWVGWLGVIGGSGFAATGDAAEALLNAQLAASAALLVGLLVERLRTGSISGNGAAMSTIAGLAAISAGAGYVAPLGAIFIGLIGAVGAAAASWIVRLFNVGSAATAFVAHGGGAILGAILFPIFVLPAFGGPGFDEGMSLINQLGTQAVAVVAVALWAAVATAVAALMISMVLPMVDKEIAP